VVSGFLDAEHVKAEIFVRESYVALADLILADFETVNEHERSGVILGGTPGVGKSTFLAFLIVLLLRPEEIQTSIVWRCVTQY
jgi:predicted PilT family ATPase